MKKYYFALVCLLFFNFCNAQNIVFDDPLFKAKLLESDASNFIARDLNGDYFAIDANNNNEIDVNEAAQVSFLEINNASLTSLSGIENCINLVSLQCQNNQISTLNVSSLSLLINLDCSNNQLTFLNTNGITELSNLNCAFNDLTSLNISGITNITTVDCSYNNLNAINLTDLFNLEVLDCSNNQLPTIDLTDLLSIKKLDCHNNVLTGITTTGLNSLEELYCNNNQISSLVVTNLTNLAILNCSNNTLNNLIAINLPLLEVLSCNYNLLTSINLNQLPNLKELSCTNNQINNLDVSVFTQLEIVLCQNNQILDIITTGLTNLITLNCDVNQLTTLNTATLTKLKYLYCNFNQLNSITFPTTNLIQVIGCTNNSLSNLNTTNLVNLQTLYCSLNQLISLDLNNSHNLQLVFCNNNALTQLFLKNGVSESVLFDNNPGLTYICADESDVDFLQSQVDSFGYTCTVNTYCSFNPGGTYYTIQGNSKLDMNTNGCDTSDNSIPTLQFSIFNGSTTEINFADESGNYSKAVTAGSYTCTPIIENPSYFNISPSEFSFEFPFDTSPFNQNFCLTPNGNHSDLEITIFPLTAAFPGGNARYKIVYKNKGTTAQSGTVSLQFPNNEVTVVGSSPVISSQTTNTLNWTFSNLEPFGMQNIVCEFNASSATIGESLAFTASIDSSNTDENPTDNIGVLRQIVVATSSSNEKKCMEGNSISESQVGTYVHYSIRFKNTGTSIAQNIIIEDRIDSSMFDVATLIPLDGSHPFTTKVTNSERVEFLFENINLSTTSSDEGYVVFKIKTLPTLTSGSIFTNTANIYFTYDEEITTNTESTVVQSLNLNETELSPKFIVFPNPVSEVLSIHNVANLEISSVEIYNSLGQLIQVITHPENNSVDVASLQTGVYILRINTDEGINSIRFSKK
jgi:uncharacterized repeat protein (TIGR01451 family)